MWCGAGVLWLAAASALHAQAASSAWLDAQQRPTSQAREALALLAGAASHGLDPADYQAAALAQTAEHLDDPAARVRWEAQLGAATAQYLQDLHQGRIDPRQIHSRFSPPHPKTFDAAGYLREALAAQRLSAAAAAAAPQLPLYGQLREALQQYRRLASPDQAALWQTPLAPLPRPRRALQPGQPYADLAGLAQRLRALGDLSPDALLEPPAANPGYAEPLVGAVQAFQRRHGLTDDGVIGPATWAALQVTPAARVRQIELTLERLRWTPLLQGPRMITINIPEFVLRAYEVQPQDGRITVREEMRVIVGKALNTRTPLFDELLRAIEFSPYWNVPPSIARAELVPRLRREPAYFEREGFEFVHAGGAVQTTLSAAALDAVLAGRARLRQRPGPRNALGDIKFVFPNSDNIYLHHTPSVGLFERERRDFSHGCIRVEQPQALAEFVLQGMPDWTAPRIRAAMESGTSTTLKLETPMPVLIAYATALVKSQGQVYFFADLYGHDRLLDQALRRRAAAKERL
jgi:L,D-transpeptidase YcbB